MKNIRSILTNVSILWYFFKDHKIRVLTVLILMLLASAMEAINLAAIYPIVNYSLDVTDNNKLVMYENFIRSFTNKDLFLVSCIILAVITMLTAVLKFVYYIVAHHFIRVIVTDTQKQIFIKLASADYAYYVRSQQGKIVYMGTTATLAIVNNGFYGIRIVNNLITCLCIASILLLLTWQGTLLMLVLGVLYMYFVKKVTVKMVNESAQKMVDADERKNIILNEFISGIKVVKVFGALHYWNKKYDESVEDRAWANFWVMTGRSLPSIFMNFIFLMIIAGAGIYFSIKYMGNHEEIILIIPLLATFVMVASRLIPYVNLLGADIMALARYMPDMKIVYSFLLEKIDMVDDGSVEIKSYTKELQFNNVRFRYQGMANDLLKGISFTLKKGKTLAIVGPSGSGKTSILNLLFRLYQPNQGQVLCDGRNINDLTSESYLSRFGYVGQETFIFNGTIAENIIFGRKNVSAQQLEEAAHLAHAHDFIMETEKKYETAVGDQGMKLSGGQRQRIAIARAMLRKPDILVLDEATSSLDNISEKAVQEAVSQIAKQTTVLIIAHRLSTVMGADHILVISNGEIVEEGCHQDLLNNEKEYFNLYNNA